MRKSVSFMLISMLTTLIGCASPDTVLSTTGPSRVGTTPQAGEFYVFEQAFSRAQDIHYKAMVNVPAGSVDDPTAYKNLATEGFALVYDNCSDFFLSAGEHEKWINFVRDTTGAAGTLATGAIGLAGGPKSAIAALGLATGTIFSGLDVYTKNFLFGADNIDAVRTLILNALDQHSKAVFADNSPWTFTNAVSTILDHQEICRPSAIVALVRATISAGKLGPAPTSGLNAADDLLAEEAIGADVGLPNGANGTQTTPTNDQLTALYWAFVTGFTPGEVATIKVKLGALASTIFKANGVDPAFAKGDDLVRQFNSLSPSVQTALANTVASWKAQVAKANAPPPSQPGAPAPRPALNRAVNVGPAALPAPSTGAPTGKHYTIVPQ